MVQYQPQPAQYGTLAGLVEPRVMQPLHGALGVLCEQQQQQQVRLCCSSAAAAGSFGWSELWQHGTAHLLHTTRSTAGRLQRIAMSLLLFPCFCCVHACSGRLLAAIHGWLPHTAAACQPFALSRRFWRIRALLVHMNIISHSFCDAAGAHVVVICALAQEHSSWLWPAELGQQLLPQQRTAVPGIPTTSSKHMPSTGALQPLPSCCTEQRLHLLSHGGTDTAHAQQDSGCRRRCTAQHTPRAACSQQELCAREAGGRA
jgi:hypothetical protein